MHIDEITAGEHYVLFTDGSCSGNPGPGGYGAVLYRMDGETVITRPIEMSGNRSRTTNNQMELLAAIKGLSQLEENDLPAIIHSDSRYVIDGMTKWLSGWKRKGWKTADNKPVKNQELWRALDGAAGGRQVEWRWVRGHSGHAGNERADTLAKAAVARSPHGSMHLVMPT